MKFRITNHQKKMLIDGKPLKYLNKSIYPPKTLSEKLKSIPDDAVIFLDMDNMQLSLEN